jgi:hypothetical protein
MFKITIHNPRRVPSYVARWGFTDNHEDARRFDQWLDAADEIVRLRGFLHLWDTPSISEVR